MTITAIKVVISSEWGVISHLSHLTSYSGFGFAHVSNQDKEQ